MPKLTKTTFNAIAQVINEVHTAQQAMYDQQLITNVELYSAQNAIARTAHKMSAYLTATNPQFDYNRFIEACGVGRDS